MVVNWADQADSIRDCPSPGPLPRLAMDTEFVRERTYYAQLGLVQVADENAIHLIDPLPEGCYAALAELLGRVEEAVMHSAGEDLEALKVATSTLPARLFDTQIAAAMAGLGSGLSLQKLIAATVGVTLEKGETRTDWLRRPLSDKQLEYAADDVRFLGQAAEQLREQLESLGRLQWVEADCSRMLEQARADQGNPYPHLGFKPAQRLVADDQHRLMRMLRWRDETARSSDKPRGWILDNPLVIQLIEQRPGTREQFDTMLNGIRGAPSKNREGLWCALSEPLSDEDRAAPLALQTDSLDRSKVKQLQQAVAQVASTLDIPESVLATRRQLEELLASHQWPSALEGWRRPLLEPAIGYAVR